MGISLETARKLKEAGLAWEPDITTGSNEGDLFYWENGNLDMVGHRAYHLLYHLERGRITFAPRLDQLLAEIERRGYWYSLARESESDNYSVMIWKAFGRIEIFYATTADEAAALALLWILEREKNG